MKGETFDTDNEWDFVVAETYNKNSTKRGTLFALQILLCQIESITKTSEKYFLRKTYSKLKEIYIS